MQGDRVFGTRFTLTEAAVVSKLNARSTSNNGGSTGGQWKGLIYAESGGTAAARAGVSAAASITAVDTWYDLTFSPAVELPAGDYFLCVVGDGSSFATRLATDGTTFDSEAQVSGFSFASPPDPWGTTSNTYGAGASIYATYDPPAEAATAFQWDAF